MPTSLETVLTIPEILELILLRLPHRTLLLAQRVNRAFHSLITSSPSIQRLLFFLPQLETAEQPTTWQQNPLFCHSFLPFFQLQPSERHRFDKQMQSGVFDLLDWSMSDEKRRAYARAEASWRRMLVVQPTVKVLMVKGHSHAMGGDSERGGKLVLRDRRLRSRDRDRFVTNQASDNVKMSASPCRSLKAEGLTMGLLYDLIEQAVMGQGNSFWLEWHMFPDLKMSDARASYDWEYTLEPTTYISMPKIEEGFKPRAEMTLFLSRTVSCVIGQTGASRRLESEAAEVVHVDFTKWEHCPRWR